MFVLKEENTFTWPVKVKVPQDKKHKVQIFDCEFKVISKSRLTEISEMPLDERTVGGSRRALRSVPQLAP